MITVLYVDDEPMLLEICRLFLERLGDFTVKTETSAKKAVERLPAEAVDVIVSDYQMPDMDGIEFLKKLRSEGNTTPFIIFTGRGREEIVTLALKEGADFYLQKGGDPRSQFAELSNQIRQIFRQRKAEEDLIRNEQKYRALFNSSQDSIILLNEFAIIDCNPQTESLLHRKKAEIIGTTVQELCFDEASRKEAEERVRLALGGESQFFEWNSAHPDGRRVVAEISLNRIDISEEALLLVTIRDISQRRRTEEELSRQYALITERDDALRESEDNFRSILSSIEDMVIVIDKNGIFREVFKEEEGLYFAPPSQFLNKAYGDVMPPQIASRLSVVIGTVKETRKTGRIDYSLHYRGQLHHYNTLISPKFDATGAYNGVILVARDITEQKTAELELRKNEAKLTTIIEGLPLPLFVIDLNHRVIHWNHSLEQYSRIAAAEMIGRDEHWKAFYPERRPLMADLLVDGAADEIPHWYSGKIIESQDPSTYVVSDFFPNFGKTGSWLVFTASLIRDPDGGVVGAVEILEDVTERKRAELAALRSEEIFTQLINTATDIITISPISQDRTRERYSEVNEIASRLLGYTREELLKLRPGELEVGDDADHIRTLLSEGRIIYETLLRTKSGELIPVEVSSHLAGFRGEEMIFSIIREISGRKRYEKAIEAANKKLNLLSQITRHDILNQLTILNGIIDLITDLNTNPELSDLIAKEMKVADTITRQISFTRDYQNVGVRSPVWQNLQETIERAASLLDAPVPVVISVGTIEVYADPLLEKVFFNLIDNALKYGKNLSKISFVLERNEPSSEMILICEDDGGGVPEKEKENIFNRKYYSNTGFGLFLSREILSITDLSISERGVFGTGARFEISLPKGTFRQIPES